MKKKYKLSIIAANYWSGDFLFEQLKKLFGDLFDITCHSPDTNPIKPIYNADLILLHEPSTLPKMQSFIFSDCPILLIRRTIKNEYIDALKEIPKGSKAVVVNLNTYMAQETMINIYQMGFKDILLNYWSPEEGNFPKCDYIITPRIYNFLPKSDIPKIIIGTRVLTADMIMDILSYFDIKIDIAENIILEHLIEAPTFFNGVKYLMKNNRSLSIQWNLLFNKINKGIVVINSHNKIDSINDNFYTYLGLEKEKEKFYSETDILSLFNIKNDIEIVNELIEFNNKKILLNKTDIYNHGIYFGKILFIDLYNNIKYLEEKSLKKDNDNINMAKYQFEDIITNDEFMKKNINLCKKISNSSSPILISGESGTGKELMASSIHNYSSRKNKPYIAINCASIPNELLEAELFGYEEGSFTGAKKGGRIGIFEKANGGTVFLDEITELPYHLQAKLLRVIQEKEIRRIGSSYNIPIDVKIISATNKKIPSLIKENKFREDLFFRLSVFNINLPPLRERTKDIPLLCNFFLKKYNSNKKLLPEFLLFSLQYDWSGNVRELENLIEFTILTSDGNIGIRNLPDYMRENTKIQSLSFDNNLSLKEYMMLKLIGELNSKFENSGRRNLKEIFSFNYFKISEIETRKIILKLKDKDLIKVDLGKKGTSLSEKGILYLHKNS